MDYLAKYLNYINHKHIIRKLRKSAFQRCAACLQYLPANARNPGLCKPAFSTGLPDTQVGMLHIFGKLKCSAFQWYAYQFYSSNTLQENWCWIWHILIEVIFLYVWSDITNVCIKLEAEEEMGWKFLWMHKIHKITMCEKISFAHEELMQFLSFQSRGYFLLPPPIQNDTIKAHPN